MPIYLYDLNYSFRLLCRIAELMSIIEYKDLQEGFIKEPASDKLNIVVTIPAFKEEFIGASLHSLVNASEGNFAVELIVLINQAEGIDEQVSNINMKTYNECCWFKSKMQGDNLKIHPIFVKNIPQKKAGVGLIRKIAMDEASHRFKLINRNGIITGFDADTLCEVNYFKAIQQHFKFHKKSPGASIHFEHPLNYTGLSTDQQQAICWYESHLRYFIQMQKYLHLPFAFQTIGSAMAVRSEAYKKIGGMNKRKAGEDFYFIQKLVKLGGFTEIKNTTVIPSARESDRVPFGTGKAITDYLRDEKKNTSYARQSFLDLIPFVSSVESFYEKDKSEGARILSGFSEAVKAYLIETKAKEVILSIRHNSKTRESFVKKFYQWFDAFSLMKYLHKCREDFYPNEDLDAIFQWYFPNILQKNDPGLSTERLKQLRTVDKQINF